MNEYKITRTPKQGTQNRNIEIEVITAISLADAFFQNLQKWPDWLDFNAFYNKAPEDLKLYIETLVNNKDDDCQYILMNRWEDVDYKYTIEKVNIDLNII